jgi:hypothetical protein
VVWAGAQSCLLGRGEVVVDTFHTRIHTRTTLFSGDFHIVNID